MQLPGTLSAYLGKQFVKNTLVIFGVLMTIVFLADFIEALRRAGDRDDITLAILIEMVLLRIPNLALKLLPFIALFGGMLTFFRLSKSSELTVIRATGVSVWQFLAPALLIAFVFGLVVLTVINPIAAAMQAQNDRMEAKYFETQTNLLTLSTNDLWLRQVDKDGLSVIHARGAVNRGIDLTDVIIFQYDRGDIFTGRIDAAQARLHPGYWELDDVVITGPNRPAERRANMELPTTLTVLQIQESFASPATLSFWDLPGFITTLEQAGFSGDRHRLYWYSLMAGPILMLAMVLVAATFSLRSMRQGRTVLLVLGGIATGFVFYFMTDIIYALGLAGNLPIIFAAWIPAVAITLFGLAMMFHLEDG
ncbi:LPS export ABC transporter permease LptG [Sneathiella chungangensis]|uniref:LPS export ABC transporter permease LptG n=1 Tax=Sneathiella chungangensis TaxID=1418234 RepID=A0A845MBV6_9PROT|nr:LPS export ABC transporter permease LptG [Sneathiella chungangensis]MZR21399.1 LPS export ABC transporter permease LptG [Sneathiella chungangensis]